jgi:hypothetical protein
VTLLIASALCLTAAVLSFFLPGKMSGQPSALTDEVEKLMEEEAEVEGVGLMLADDRILTESGE